MPAVVPEFYPSSTPRPSPRTGKLLSFIYDIADLYQTEVTVLVAFDVGATEREGPDGVAAFMARVRAGACRAAPTVGAAVRHGT